MIKASLIGLGKMGISHLAMLNAHPEVEVVGVCDTSGFLTGCMQKLTNFDFFSDYKKMLKEKKPDCIMIATPTSSHGHIVSDCLNEGVHVFVEKPFCLQLEEGRAMVDLAEKTKLVNQVGYHNKFVGSFQKAKQLIDKQALGEIYAVRGEAYGPVVLQPKGSTWRTQKNEGGGCLHDYASHVVDLMNYYVGVPEGVDGTILKKVFSRDVEDAVYSTFRYRSGVAGQIFRQLERAYLPEDVHEHHALRN